MRTLITATGALVTVTTQLAVFAPSVVVTVIVALPAALAVTSPSAETEATASELDDQVTLASVASAGLTVALSCSVAPTSMVVDGLLTLTPVTATGALVTVTAQLAVLAPSVVVTVIVALPAALAVTSPSAETEAMASALDDQATLASVASAGLTVAVSRPVALTVRERLDLSRLTPLTATDPLGSTGGGHDVNKATMARHAIAMNALTRNFMKLSLNHYK